MKKSIGGLVKPSLIFKQDVVFFSSLQDSRLSTQSGCPHNISKPWMWFVHEIALFVPAPNEMVIVSADKTELDVLEIEIALSEKEYADFKNQNENSRYYKVYSKCKKYKEAIKSKKTTSRMLLPENRVPRFCVGSVETYGPDEVGKHKHPMLEQLFFGLEKNDCVVTADDQETEFKEYMLLHIPLGSEHGVKVEAGKNIHYIWMDLFRSQKEMKYITESHIMDGG